MQTANVIVALGGDINNTVPKYGVTAAEIGVLQAIHGMDAIFDVEPTGEVSMNNRQHREELRMVYGRAKDNNNNSIFELIIPGAAARVFETLDELTLVPEQYKASSRMTAMAPEEELAEEDEAEEMEEAPKPAKAAKAAKGKPAKAKKEEIQIDEGDLDELPADDKESVLD